MDAMLPSRLGKLRIICSLPLFSDAICIKQQSSAEQGFTQVLLSIALAPRLKFSEIDECALIELAIFAELPKSLLGDPSYYLRQRHPDMQDFYGQVRGRLWRETEESCRMRTTRSPDLYGLHELIDSYVSMLYIEKESLLGNEYFKHERYRTHYQHLRQQALRGLSLAKTHPGTLPEDYEDAARTINVNWIDAVNYLDKLFDDANRARLEGGIGEYSATFVGMMEKLKEHYRYKGWSYHYPESVGEHTFQVVFFARIVADALNLSPRQRIDLYRLATLHDLAEAYASDVVYPVKMREKDLGQMHRNIEEKVTDELCDKLGFSISRDKTLESIVDICDRFSAQLYFDREQRSGNTLFNVANSSMAAARGKYQAKYPEVFKVIDELWNEYTECFK